MNFFRNHVLIGVDNSSMQDGVKNFEMELKKEISKHNLNSEINILETGNLGFFGKGICMLVYPEKITYANLKIEDISLIVEEHFLKGRPVKKYQLITPKSQNYDYKYEGRIVLDNSGLINPENIEEYIGVGGYESWGKVLTEMKPQDVIQIVKDSKLRGRGGAGFPTGLKWTFTAPLENEKKYFVINADEGEPGTFKDRLIMEGDPHKLLEGIMIGSFAVGASKAYIYIRGEYKLCINRLQNAINQAKEYGLLGENIFSSGFNLEIEIKIGAGAYVCGEETALIESMEGNRGTPRSKPPFPGVKGAWQKPTVVNNVETISNVPKIILKGAEWFRNIGPEESCGTKVYTILGDVKMPGLCEVPMGTPFSEIITNFGGGMADDKEFKAALVGGAAGVFISKGLWDVEMDYVHLKEYAAALGSGAILVMAEGTDIVDMLYSVIRFFRHESCGKCTPCSNGTQELFVLINRIKHGLGKESDLDIMLKIAEAMKYTAFCGLGQSVIMPTLSAIKNFREDFLEKINKEK